MMDEAAVRRWRDLELNRLGCLVDDEEYGECKRVVMLLTAVLGDD